MYQLIDVLDMKEGTMYFIKKLDYIIEELVFLKYQMLENGYRYATFVYPYHSIYSHKCLSVISVYRYVSEEEYRSKIKEKYDAKCLGIVLKRLVDESFEW
jgi:hypothetical protein